MSQSSVSTFSQSTSSLSTKSFDPLVALHDHRLEQHPELDSSVLSDDEMIELLKKAKDPKELEYLNMDLTKQCSSSDGSECIAVEAGRGCTDVYPCTQARYSPLSHPLQTTVPRRCCTEEGERKHDT